MMELMRSLLVFCVENSFLYSLLCFVTTIALSACLHQLFTTLNLITEYCCSSPHFRNSSELCTMNKMNGFRSSLHAPEGVRYRGSNSLNNAPDVIQVKRKSQISFTDSQGDLRGVRSREASMPRIGNGSDSKSFFRKSHLFQRSQSTRERSKSTKRSASTDALSLQSRDGGGVNSQDVGGAYSSNNALRRAFVSVTNMMRQISEASGSGLDDVSDQSKEGTLSSGAKSERQSEIESAMELLMRENLYSEEESDLTNVDSCNKTLTNGDSCNKTLTNGDKCNKTLTSGNQCNKVNRRIHFSTGSADEYCSHCHGNGNHDNAMERQLKHFQEEISKLQKQNTSLRDRLSEQAERRLRERGEGESPVFEDLSLGEMRPTFLIKRYEDLYTNERMEALDDLDLLPELNGEDLLKQDLLVQLLRESFRQAERSLINLKENIRKLLLNTNQPAATTTATEATITSAAAAAEDSLQQSEQQNQLFSSCCSEDLQPVFHAVSFFLRKQSAFQQQQIQQQSISPQVEEIMSRVIHSDLRYPSHLLTPPSSLHRFTSACYSLAWGLTLQAPKYVLVPLHPPPATPVSPPPTPGLRGLLMRAYRRSESAPPGPDDEFNEDRHTRFHTSSLRSVRIRRVVWPGLAESGPTRDCPGFIACKVIVIT